MKAILDTSSIIFAIENRMDPFDFLKEQYCIDEIIINKGILNELKHLADTKRRISGYAKIAIELIKKHKNISIINNNESGDSFIKSYAKKGIIIFTNDKRLKKEVKEKATVITISRKPMVVGCT